MGTARKDAAALAFLLVVCLSLVSLRPAAAAGKIMIFGGQDHRTYLGCLSCSQFSPDSVFNEFSRYGNPFSGQSVFNHFSPYGSLFSPYSACNQYATDPPVLVDEDGLFYGRLTLNLYHRQANRTPDLINWLKYKVCT
jgi:hypothetical protein